MRSRNPIQEPRFGDVFLWESVGYYALYLIPGREGKWMGLQISDANEAPLSGLPTLYQTFSSLTAVLGDGRTWRYVGRAL